MHIPHHAYGGWRENPWFLPAFFAGYGYLGVPLFVIISGFCIHFRSAQDPSQHPQSISDWRHFWLRRFLRLYPPYLAAIIFSLGTAFFVHHRYPGEQTRVWIDLGSHLTMLNNLSPLYVFGLGNGVFWSLGMEDQLYLLYMLFSAAFLFGRWRLLVGLAATATVLTRVWHAVDPSYEFGPHWFPIGKPNFWPTQYWLHWVLGALSVEAVCGGKTLPRWSRHGSLGIVLVALGVLLNDRFGALVDSFRALQHFTLFNSFRQLLVEVPWLGPAINGLGGDLCFLFGFWILFNWCVSRDKGRELFDSRWLRPLAALGRTSYSLYLVHIPVIYCCEAWFPIGTSPRDWILGYIVYSGASLIVAGLFYVAIERPSLRLHSVVLRQRAIQRPALGL